MALPLVFDFYNSIIEVPAPDTTLEMQYLINQIRDTEDELTPGMAYSKIADASGKEDLGGGVATAITVRLLDNWRVRFEARSGPDTVQCTISGGNLVGGPGGNPIAPSAFTQVLNLSSAAGVIATPTTTNENINLKYMLASLGTKQRAIGSVFYWDPYSGSDTNSGLTPTAAVKTFAKAQTLATTGAHDVIFCLSSDPSGITTVTETISITKHTLKLRGPGYVFQFVPTTDTNPTISIAADNVEVSGFYISTASFGNENGLVVNGNNALIQDCWLENVRGHGIALSSSNLSVISACVMDTCGISGTGDGINIGNSTQATTITNCIINDSVNGIALSGTNITDNVIGNCLIYKNSGYGITIGSGVNRTMIRDGNTIVKNTAGNTLDNGTDTYIETPAGGASASEIADAVWNEVITGVTGAGTAGKMLKDAKTKATLASLK